MQLSTNEKAVTPPPLGRAGYPGRMRWSYTLTAWLGLVPFFLFCLLFELLPAVVVIQESLRDEEGAFTFNNFQRVFSNTSTLNAFQQSISVSLVTSVLGAFLGFLAAYGVYRMRTGWLRNLLVSFSNIAANFAGVPLAFAFIATLGVAGYATIFLRDILHVDLYAGGFSVYTFWGLVLVYLYFQLPLMVLVTLPALNALRPEWREAATNLGASTVTYWMRVALPVLFPSIVASTMLLFANAFGAFATAYALAGANINLVPILISFVVSGDVDIDIGLGNALAACMVIVLLIVVLMYTAMIRRASTWQGK